MLESCYIFDMDKDSIEALFDSAFEQTSYEYEYARKMLYRAYDAFLVGDYALCAFEVRSFPMEVTCPLALEEWANNYHS